MSRKKPKNTSSGTYALCVTTGLIIGLGFAPLTNNMLISVLSGGLFGFIIAYLITRNVSGNKRKSPH